MHAKLQAAGIVAGLIALALAVAALVTAAGRVGHVRKDLDDVARGLEKLEGDVARIEERLARVASDSGALADRLRGIEPAAGKSTAAPAEAHLRARLRDALRSTAAPEPREGLVFELPAPPREAAAKPAGGEPPPDCDFEKGLDGWIPLWTREAGAGRASHDTTVAHSGKGSVRIEHKGAGEWGLSWRRRDSAEPGDMFEIVAWVRVEGEGAATLCATLRDARREVIDWAFAGRSINGPSDWQRLRSRFAAPPGAVSIEARLIGEGAATVWMDDFSFRKTGNGPERGGAGKAEDVF